ncbi:MAG: hypothetical protein ABWX96_19075 [Propionibacteriaceae bacterium]
MTRSRSTGLVSLLICLALVVLITVLAPDPAAQARRRFDDVTIGQSGELRNAVVRATGVRLTRSVAKQYEGTFDSAATLVLVDVEADVRREQVYFSTVRLHTTDDHDYLPRSEFISQGLALTQPGFTRRGTLVFEVPPDRTVGARLIIDRDAAAFDVLAVAVRVDLGLTSTTPVLPGPLAVANSVLEVTR